MINQVLQGDCLELMKDIPDGSVIYKIGGDPKLVYIDIKNISK